MAEGISSKISPDSGVLWTEPGAFEAAPGVWRIPLPLPMDGLRAVNIYVLETEEGLTLVDGGWAIAESRERLDSGLASMGYSVRDIRRFLVTHVHRDHYSQAVALRAEVGASVSLGLGERPQLELMKGVIAGEVTDDPFTVQLLEAGAVDIAKQWGDMFNGETPDEFLGQIPDEWLDGEHQIKVGQRTLDAVPTPGHTRGHFVFADQPGGVLFAGDHVLPHITPSIGFEPVTGGQPLGDFMGSLGRVLELPDLTLLPAHGPVGQSSHERSRELLDHHEQRLAQCLAGVRSGGSAAIDVANTLGWTRREFKFVDLDIFNAALAALETKAHLQLLVRRGELQRTTDGATFVYSPA